MEKMSIAGVFIVVNKRSGEWHAQTDGTPRLMAYGVTKAEAVGALLLKYAAQDNAELDDMIILRNRLDVTNGKLNEMLSAVGSLNIKLLFAQKVIDAAKELAANRYLLTHQPQYGFAVRTGDMSALRAALETLEKLDDQAQEPFAFEIEACPRCQARGCQARMNIQKVTNPSERNEFAAIVLVCPACKLRAGDLGTDKDE
jgi:hypothetical protein